MEQLDIFGQLYEKYRCTKPIRLIELFSGYGSQSLALKYLGVDFEKYQAVDFDKYAIQSYNEIHNTNYPPTDITKLESLNIKDTDKYSYWMFYSFPCTDISNAGKMLGYKEDSNTRSSLLWQCKRLLENEKEKPEVLIMENVPGVLSDKESWNKWISFLEGLGYQSYWKILNAKDYGIPQNRKRCFCVSVLNAWYEFPKGIKLKYRLKDLLEDVVDENYYLSQKMINYLLKEDTGGYPRRDRFLGNMNRKNQDIGNAVTTIAGQRPCDNFIVDEENKEKVKKLGSYSPSGFGQTAVVDKEGLAPTVTENHGQVSAVLDGLKIKNATKTGYIIATDGDGVDLEQRKGRRGTVQKGVSQTLKTQSDVGVVVDNRNLAEKLCDKLIQDGQVHEGDVIKHSYSNQILNGNKKAIEKDNEMITLTTRADCVGVAVNTDPICLNSKVDGKQPSVQNRVYDSNGSSTAITTSYMPNFTNNLRIRKLTEKECFRLMGVKDQDYNKLTTTKSQKYKQAGNSIVVQVLMGLFGELLGMSRNEYQEKIRQSVESLKE